MSVSLNVSACGHALKEQLNEWEKMLFGLTEPSAHPKSSPYSLGMPGQQLWWTSTAGKHTHNTSLLTICEYTATTQALSFHTHRLHTIWKSKSCLHQWAGHQCAGTKISSLIASFDLTQDQTKTVEVLSGFVRSAADSTSHCGPRPPLFCGCVALHSLCRAQRPAIPCSHGETQVCRCPSYLTLWPTCTAALPACYYNACTQCGLSYLVLPVISVLKVSFLSVICLSEKDFYSGEKTTLQTHQIYTC